MRLEEDWRKITTLGPRFMGTDGAERAVRVLEGLFGDRWIVENHEFAYSGWEIHSGPEFELTSPVTEKVEAQPLICGAPTPPEG